MRNIAALLVLALLPSGAVWAQVPVPAIVKAGHPGTMADVEAAVDTSYAKYAVERLGTYRVK